MLVMTAISMGYPMDVGEAQLCIAQVFGQALPQAAHGNNLLIQGLEK